MGTKKTMVKIIMVIFIFLALALFLNWSNKALVTTEYQYANSQIPKKFNGYRITQVSDLQSESFGNGQKDLIAAVKKTMPDMIVITGDLLDRNHTNYEASLTAARKLVEIAPVFYTNGNHELALPEEDTAEFYDDLREMGVHVLMDQAEFVEGKSGQGIYIMGLSEYTVFASKESESRTDTRYDPSVITDMISSITDKMNKDGMVIMLTHEPQYLEAYANEKVDLIFAGHAHGGQIRLPFTEGLFSPGQGILPKLTSGLHTEGNTTMVISRGLGNSIFPFRLFNRPEVVVVQLKGE